jgi:hypothetical protein
MKSAKSTDLSKSESALESIESSSIAEAFDAVLPSKYYANQYHLIAFALLGSLSNIYSVWNVAVGSGLGVQIICSIVFGICYLFAWVADIIAGQVDEFGSAVASHTGNNRLEYFESIAHKEGAAI